MRHHIKNNHDLQKKGNELRIKTLELLENAPSGHVGGALGMADVFAAVYYHFADVDPHNPDWADRDYILLSNGHICPIWYATLWDLGFFDAQELKHLRQIGHLLQGHPKRDMPWVENSSGPLGHGLSQAIGMAHGLKMDSKKNRVICLMSDGEHQEWQTWEAIMSAPKWWLDNLICIMDHNDIQIEWHISEIMPLGDIERKYLEFGWAVTTIDGHNMEAITEALHWADKHQKPSMIIANTIAGKGVDFMEWKWEFHDWKWDPEHAKSGIAQISSLL